ncbi:MAG: LysM domain-containing protein [Anaerovoracaceae bacterium]
MKSPYICVAICKVAPGDTLYSIAKAYKVPVDLLMAANKITNPYNLTVGAKLCIPGKEENIPNPPEDVPDPCQVIHRVDSGDTLYMIAKMHKVTLDALMKANPNVDPYELTIGMELCIPKA